MPSRRRIQLAVPLVTLIAGVRNRENHHCGRRRPARGRQRFGDGEVLGHQLAEDHRHRRGDQQRQRQARCRRACSRAAPIAVERRAASSRGDDGFGEITGDQRGDRDAELGAGQLERQRAVGAAGRRSSRQPPVRGVGVDGAAFQCGQRELGGDEHRRPRRQDDEGQQGEQSEDEAHREPRTMGAGPWARLPTERARRRTRLRGRPRRPGSSGPRRVPAARVPFRSAARWTNA